MCVRESEKEKKSKEKDKQNKKLYHFNAKHFINELQSTKGVL